MQIEVDNSNGANLSPHTRQTALVICSNANSFIWIAFRCCWYYSSTGVWQLSVKSFKKPKGFNTTVVAKVCWLIVKGVNLTNVGKVIATT